MSDGKVLIEIDLNDDGVNKALNDIEGKAVKSSSKIGASISKLSDQSVNMAKNAALGIVGISAAFAGLSINAAGELAATNAQFETVFGGLQKEAQKSIDAMADEFGMVNTRLKPSMSKMTSMFKGLGLDTADAMKLATDAVTLSADAAAFYDVAYEDANASLSSFLKGNYEAGESIGIFANDTQMATYAIEKGVVSSTAEWQKLDEATKQATRLEYAKNMQEMAGATGQAARESDGLENVMGNVRQALTDLAAAFGTPLLAPFISAAKVAVGVLSNLAKAFSDNPALVYAVAGAVVTLASAFGAVYIAANKMKILSSIQSGVALLSNPLFLAVAAVGALITAFVYFYNSSEGFRNAVNKLLAPLKEMGPVFENVGAVIKTVGQIIKAFFTNFKDVGKYKDVLGTILPPKTADAIFNGLMNVLHPINDLINGFKAIAKVATGSITSMYDLEGFLAGSFGREGTDRIMAIGKAIKGLVDGFKDLFNPTKKAGESIDFLQIGFNILKGAALTLLGPIGLVIKIVELIARALGGGDVQAGIQTMLDGFSNLSSGIKEAGGQVGASVGDMLSGILTAIGSALPGIIQGALSIIAGFISGLAQGLPQVALAAVRLIAAFTGSMMMLIPTIAASATLIIVTLLGSLAAGLPQIILAGINLLVSLIAGLTAGIPQFVLAITNLIVVFLTSITANLPRILLAGTNLLVAFLQGLIDNLPKIVETVGTLITTFLDAVTEKLPSIIEKGTNLLVSFLQGIADNLPKVITAATDVIVSFLNGIANNLPRILNAAVNLMVSFLRGIANNLPRIVSAAVDVIVAFLRGIASQIGRIVSAAMDLVDAMVRGILQAQGRLTSAIITLMNGMARNIEQSAPQMRSAAGNLLRAIIEAFPGGALVTAGFDLMAGLAKGIGNAVGSVISKAKEVAGNIVGAVKGALGIHSPSRVMRDEVGRYLPQGIAVGMEDDTNKAIKAARTMASKVVNSIPTAEMAMGINAKMSTNFIVNRPTNRNGAVSGNKETVIHQTFHLDKNMSERDLQRQALLQSRKLGYELGL